ncbi:MAG: hypothetical protein GF368_05510 [Candidatus Aenigmarchaeota archaeon]|nr:hypothetical protein [Candidatus Aenigmarchaeota archaeon]
MTLSISALNVTNTTNIINFAKVYASSIPNLIIQGDIAAITVGSIIFLVTVFLLNKVTGLMLNFIKKTIFLLITGLAVYYLSIEFYTRISTAGLTLGTLLLGITGVLISVLGIYLSVNSWFTGAKRSFKDLKYGPDLTDKPEEDKEVKKIEQEIMGLRKEFSLQMLKQDKNLLSVLVYLIIGQFGIFSSPTVAPPNPGLGLVFFALFLTGALLFVKQTYKNFKRGLSHLIVALIFGFILSLVLGHFWSGIPLETLFSIQYFGTSCVVAVITGMAVSLIMSGK